MTSVVTAGLLVAVFVCSLVLLPRAEPVVAAVPAVSIQRVSVPSAEGDGGSFVPSVSADGRYVAFHSAASNLVPGDSNGASDVFVFDRRTGETTRVSVRSNGTQSDGDSYSPSISADGRYVAFDSRATNLVDGDGNGSWDIFLHDRQTATTTRISVDSSGNEAGGSSYGASISADGWYVAFYSYANNLVPFDTGRGDVFVRDRHLGETTRVSVRPDGGQASSDSLAPSISADGRYVAFESYASDLVSGDTNGVYDIFVRDRQAGETTRVSVRSNGTQGNRDSGAASISADGRYVTYESQARNLVGSDPDDGWDVFVHDRQTRETTRASVDSEGTRGDGESRAPSISADGRYVAFESDASNLVGDDSNGRRDIFVRDTQPGGGTIRVSLRSDGGEGNGHSYNASVSADGRYVAFDSEAFNLVVGDANGSSDVFVRDRVAAETGRISLPSGTDQADGESGDPSISGDGRYVAFSSDATNLVANDTNGMGDIFVRDRQTGQTTRVSVDSFGAQGDDSSYYPSISADGRYVAFESRATNLVSTDNNNALDVFVHDRQTRTTTMVSLHTDNTQGNSDSLSASISGDGRYVAFQSYATNLVTSDNNGAIDVFVRDLQMAVTVMVSVDSVGGQGNDHSFSPSISTDGPYVAFESLATNLVSTDNNGVVDVFVRDLQPGGLTTMVSLHTDNYQGDNHSFSPSISADGRYVAFYSWATNLVSSDNNNCRDVFVRDRLLGQTTMVSLRPDGTQGNGDSYSPSISADGQRVTFTSEADNLLLVSDNNSQRDVFVRDWELNTTTRVNLSSDGTEGDGDSYLPSISADGQHVAFGSDATNLVADDTNGTTDVFAVSWQNPELAYAPASMDFGDRYQNVGATQILQIENSGTGVLSYTVSEASPWCSVSPGSGESGGETDNVSVSIDTSGLSLGEYDCVVLIASDGGLGVVPVHVSVEKPPTIVVTPPARDFGSVSVGSWSDQTFTVSNSGTENLTIGKVAFTDPLAAPFSVLTDNCSDETLLPGDNRTLTVRFNPTAKGSFADSFDIPSNDPDTPVFTATLTGSAPNRLPTAPVVDVTPNSPTTTNDLVCTITTPSTDSDNDTVTYTYQWYKDGVLQSSLSTNTVAAAQTTRGDSWKCVVTPSDGTPGPSGEDSVTIQNTLPTAPVVDVTPDSPGTDDNLTCMITAESTDADIGDAMTYTYRWFKDGVLQTSLTANAVAAANTGKGEVWKCVVTPYDGTGEGPSAEDQVTIMANSAPTQPVVDVTPDNPTTTSDLVCNITTPSTDPDGGDIGYTYEWFKDGELQPSLTTKAVVAAATAKGQIWKCRVTPSDSVDNGPAGEDQVTIRNSVPTAPVVDVTPNSPASDADLVCSIITPSADDDADAIAYAYQWYKDGVLQSSQTTDTVAASQTSRGQVWKCVVIPSDGTPGTSAEDQVTVLNSVPTAPIVAISPGEPRTMDDLVCIITTGSVDVDGDTIGYTFQWYKDGELQTALTGDTVGAAETGGGQEWKCVVTPTDGTAKGASDEDRVTITGSGSFPVWIMVVIIIAVLVVTGVAAYFWFGRKKKASSAQ